MDRARCGETVTVRGVRGGRHQIGKVVGVLTNSHGTRWYSVRYEDGTTQQRIPAARVIVYRFPGFEAVFGGAR